VFGSFSLQLVLCSAAVCSMITGTLLAFFHPEAPAKASDRMLTFGERVAYQRAIEDVYWRHRTWPKENSKAKPSLDEVMSAQQIEKKVEDYLRDSQALEDYWQRPITPDQLQAEMGLDGQPNGHLGRIRQQQRSEHRREILRATWFHAYTHADSNTDTVRAISYTITYAYDTIPYANC